MTLKEQIIDVIEKHPEFVEWLEQEYDFSFCPPGGFLSIQRPAG